MKKKSIILILIIVLVIVALVIVFLLKGKSLNTESPTVTDLYSYLGSNNLEVCSGLATYDVDGANYDSLDNKTRICMAYSLLELDDSSILKIDKTKKNNTCSVGENITFATDNYEGDICTVTKVSADSVSKQYEKMYGKPIESFDEFQYNATTICYYEDGYYYCGLSEQYTATIGNEPHTFRTIKSAKEKDDTITIYDYFVKIVGNECYTSYNQDEKNGKCTDNYTENMEVDYKFLKKYGTAYKHTFKKDGDNYHWVKSELVER